jgi:uncharacterized protein YbjT (DUF2867 family)
MPARTLVIGATGTVGRHVLHALLARGVPVAALSSRPDAVLPAGVSRAVGDLRDPASLAPAMAGIERLFLLLPLVPDKAQLATNALAAARAAGVQHVVRSSAIGADAASPVAISRLQGEIDAQVAASGIPYTLLRPSGFMQNYAGFGAAMIRAGRYFAAHGDGATGLIDAADIGAAAAAVLADPAPHAGAAYTLTGSRAWTDAQAMAVIAAALGREVAYVAVPDAAARAALAPLGIPDAVLDWLDSLNASIRRGELAALTDDVQRLTGRAPTPFEDFVQRHLDAWR